MDFSNIDSKKLEWVAYGVVILSFIIYRLIKAHRNGQTLFAIKKIAESFLIPIKLFLAMYIMMAGALFIKPINTMIAGDLATHTGFLYWFYRSIPLAVVIVIIFVAFKVFGTNWIKYSDKEKEWLKVEEKESNSKMPKFLRKILGNNEEDNKNEVDKN